MQFYSWVVIYQDGTSLAERDGHVWDEVDTSRVQYVTILNAVGLSIFSAAIPPGIIPEFFRRSFEGNATCVGWPGAYVWFLDSGVMALTAGKEVTV